MPFYLIPVESKSFDSIEALTAHVTGPNSGIEPANYRVVQGIPKRLVPKLELRPLDDKPATKRDAKADEAMCADVLDFVRDSTGPVKVDAVAKALKISNADVSRAKAKLIKDGKLDAAAKKGTLQAKAAA